MSTAITSSTGSSATVQGEVRSADPHSWAQVVEERNRPLYDQVVEWSDPRPGTRPLDAGCGLDLLDLADSAAARAAPSGAGSHAVTRRDVVFVVAFENVDDAVHAQLPAGPVVAAVRHSGQAVVEDALRSFFEPRARLDGTVRMRVVFCCYFVQRGR
jgi:hypothetical protein